MSYIYKTKGTCSTRIEVELDGDIIKEVRFTGGCNGNLQAVSRLVAGRPVSEVIDTLSGIRCGMRPTSCGDQLSKALLAARAASQN
ncbi:MAG: TIGR03905 family TSCPD domain-containing protein [Lachnospiraceae bacterium]|nr:TIGR03905 family TSCPD domain-containing protein [Lachnospiraceae bacterium]